MKRVAKIQKALSTYDVDALIVQNPIDLFYLTDMDLSAGKLVIAKNDVRLFVDGRYLEKCKMQCKIQSAKEGFEAFCKKYKTIGFDENSTSYSGYIQLVDLKRDLKPLSKPVEKIRAIKEASEIKIIKKAAALCQKGFDFVTGELRSNITEKEIAKKLEIFWLSNGGQKLSFEPIIAFGKNSSMPHYRAQNTKLKPGDIVLIDIGVYVDGYASDITRVVFYGKPDPKLWAIYDIVQEAKNKAFKACKAGVRADVLYKKAAQVIEKAGYLDAFLHSLGHGLGLEVHEYPTLKTVCQEPVKAGMVVTLEPGIYIPNLGGVRLEDMVLIGKDKASYLTTSTKEKLILPAVF